MKKTIMTMQRVFLTTMTIFIVSGCTAGTKPVADNYSTGKHYFLRECGRCHNLIYPEEHSQTEWQHILAKKRGRISLTSEQFAELENYIMFYAEK